MSKTAWISVKDRYPENGARVLAKYEGVYGPTVVTYWYDGINHHFGDPPFSNPATHWCPIPQNDHAYSTDPQQALLELVDGAYDIIELWKPETPAQIEWRRAWMEKARELGAQPSW